MPVLRGRHGARALGRARATGRRAVRAVAWLLCLLFSLVVHRADARRGGKRDRGPQPPRRALNMPPGWTWPPSPSMLEDGKRCLRRLDSLGVVWEEGRPTRKIVTPVVIPSMELAGIKLTPLYGHPPYVIDCHLAETLAAGAAPVLRKHGVRELRVTSLHAYRNLRGRRIMSRHAVGLAVDVYEFVMTDGTVRRVKGGYWSRDGLQKTIERGLRETGLFRGPITPGNDRRGHNDHFHIEARTPPERKAPVPNA
jgi:hypothetical protein